MITKLATRGSSPATYVRTGSDVLLHAVADMIRHSRYFHGQAVKAAADAREWDDNDRAAEHLAIAAYYRKCCAYWLAQRAAGNHFARGPVTIAWPID